MKTYPYTLNLKITRSQKERLKIAAERAGMPVSEFHRKVLFESLDMAPDAKLSLWFQASVAHFIKRLFVDCLAGITVSSDRLTALETEALESAPALADEFIAFHQEKHGE